MHSNSSTRKRVEFDGFFDTIDPVPYVEGTLAPTAGPPIPSSSEASEQTSFRSNTSAEKETDKKRLEEEQETKQRDEEAVKKNDEEANLEKKRNEEALQKRVEEQRQEEDVEGT